MEQTLRKQITQAMKDKKTNPCMETTVTCQTLKNILETAQKIAKEKKAETISDSMIFDAAKKELKQLDDLMNFVSPTDSGKILEIETAVKTAKSLLPEMVSESEIQAFVEQNKANAGNIGAMMKLLKKKFGDRLDGKLASRIVKNTL